MDMQADTRTTRQKNDIVFMSVGEKQGKGDTNTQYL
jgi:hypothetical protein